MKFKKKKLFFAVNFEFKAKVLFSIREKKGKKERKEKRVLKDKVD